MKVLFKRFLSWMAFRYEVWKGVRPARCWHNLVRFEGGVVFCDICGARAIPITKFRTVGR